MLSDTNYSFRSLMRSGRVDDEILEGKNCQIELV